MPMKRDQRIFFKRDRGLYRILERSVFLAGVLLFAGLVYFLNSELGADQHSPHEPSTNRFAFAQPGFKLGRDEFTEYDGLLTHGSTQAPLTGSLPKVTSRNALHPAPEESAASDEDLLDRDFFASQSKTPIRPDIKPIEPPTAVRSQRIPEQEHSATVASLTVDEPSKTTREATQVIERNVGRLKRNPTVRKSHRMDRRRRVRAGVRRPTNSAGPPLYGKLPPWARQALFNAGS